MTFFKSLPRETICCHDKDAPCNLDSARAAQMTWGLRMTDGTINTFLLLNGLIFDSAYRS